MSTPTTAAGRALLEVLAVNDRANGETVSVEWSKAILAIEDQARASRETGLDVERLTQALINTRFTWTDFRARFIAERLAVEYAALTPEDSRSTPEQP